MNTIQLCNKKVAKILQHAILARQCLSVAKMEFAMKTASKTEIEPELATKATLKNDHESEFATKASSKIETEPELDTKASPENENEVDLTTKVERTKSITSEDMQWRTPWHQKKGAQLSMLRSFYTEDSNTSFLKFIQTPINLSPTAIKTWWLRKQKEANIAMQQYLPERHLALGNELAAAHFIVHRGGAVKFFGDDRWIKATKQGKYELPRFRDDSMVLEAIDCSEMELYYEGLVNIANLKQVEWLSFRYCEEFDDWCLDRVTNMFRNSLVYLDIRNCPKLTELGLCAIYKMDSLKMLYVDSMCYKPSLELTCVMLQEANLDLDIKFD